MWAPLPQGSPTPKPTKTNNASSIEMTLEHTGVSRATKNKSPRSELITDISPGLNSEPGAPTTPVASEEVLFNFDILLSNRRISIFELICDSGFQVFSKNCANCHSIMGKKYDLLLDKVYEQL